MTVHQSTLSSDGTAGTISGSGARYVLMATWEATAQGQHGAGDQTILECYRGTTTEGNWQSDGSLNENGINITGWTTSAGNGITVRAAVGNEHNGVFASGFYLKKASSNFTSILSYNQQYITVQDIEVWETTSTHQTAAVTTGSLNTVTERCIYRNDSTNASGRAISPSAAQTLVNSFMRGYRGVVLSNYNASSILNCTIVGTGTYGLQSHTSGSSYPTVKNTYAEGPTEAFRNNYDVANCENNAANDTSAPGTSPVNNVTRAAFVDPDNDDWTPVSTGALDGVGADLSGTFTDDITGYTRVVPWEIGAYEIQAAGGPVDSNLLPGGPFTTTGPSGVTVTGAVTALAATTTGAIIANLVRSTGAVTGQAASTTGQVYPYFLVDATGAVVAQGAVTTGAVSTNTDGVLITLTLVNENGTPLANLANLQWAFFDQALPSTMLAPVDQGTDETTDGSGVLTVRAQNSLLTPGQTGYFIVSDTDGTEGQSPAQQAFAGPVGTS